MRIVTMLMVPGHELWRDLRAQRHHAHHDAGTDARRKGRDTSCEQDDGKASASSGCMRAGAKRHRPQRERCEPDGGHRSYLEAIEMYRGRPSASTHRTEWLRQ
jgi:hypothetical protein